MKQKFVTLPIEGMTCASCVSSIEKALKSLEGVEEANANLALGNVSLIIDCEKVSQERIVEKISEAGYSCPIDKAGNASIKSSAKEGEIDLKQLLLIFLLALPVAFIGMFYHHWLLGLYLSFLLTSLLILFPARVIFIRAWSQFMHRAPAMDLLVALSTLSAYVFSSYQLIFDPKHTGHFWFETPAMLLTFVLTGRYLEGKARRQSTDAVNNLKQLQPEFVKVIRNGQNISIPVDEVIVHDRVLILPYDVIPVDGIILRGQTEIDESSLTGEAMPVAKTKGDTVFAGTRNLEGGITVLVTHATGQTLLDGIIRSVALSLATKSPSQQLADRISGIFVPVVLALATLTFITWFLVTNSFSQALTFSITVLIIACPCALGLATPTALVAAAGNAARHGFLFREGDVMENAGLTTLAAFDKTGTLTLGQPSLKDSLGLDQLNTGDIIIFYSMEKTSQHPLASPIAKAFEKLPGCQLSDEVQHKVKSIPGKGLSYSNAEGTKYFIEGLSGFNNPNIELSDLFKSFVEKNTAEGYTLIHGRKGNQVLWIIAAGDAIRDDARDTLWQLHRMGIRNVLLTGDHSMAAQKIAQEIGIDAVFANLLPGQKKEIIESFKQQGEHVLMIGDGINDAAALAAADVSASMIKGSSLALDIAGITLIGNRLTSLPFAIRLSRLTRRIIRQNLFWAFIYNVVCLPLAAGTLYPFTGFTLSPMIAGAAMSLSSLMVVSNSLRITRFSEKNKN